MIGNNFSPIHIPGNKNPLFKGKTDRIMDKQEYERLFKDYSKASPFSATKHREAEERLKHPRRYYDNFNEYVYSRYGYNSSDTFSSQTQGEINSQSR